MTIKRTLDFVCQRIALNLRFYSFELISITNANNCQSITNYSLNRGPLAVPQKLIIVDMLMDGLHPGAI